VTSDDVEELDAFLHGALEGLAAEMRRYRQRACLMTEGNALRVMAPEAAAAVDEAARPM